MPNVLSVFLNLGGNYQPQMAAVANQTVAANARMAESAREMAAAQNIAMQQILNTSTSANVVINQTTNVINKTASAATNAAKAGGSMANVLRQLLTIGGELSRGQMPRAIATTARMLADLGIPLAALIPIGLAVGTTFYLAYKGFHGLVQEAEKLGKSAVLLKTRIEAHIDTMREAAEEAKRYREELEKIGRSGEGNEEVKAAEDVIAAMRKKFELQQQIARAAGQTPQQRLAAEKEEAKKEAATLASAAGVADRELKISKANAEALNTPEKNEELRKQKEELKVAKENAEVAKATLVDSTQAVKEVGFFPKWMGGAGFHPITATGNLIRGAMGKAATTPLGTVDPNAAKKDSATGETWLAARQAAVDAAEEKRRLALEDYTRKKKVADELAEKAKAAGAISEAENEVAPGENKKHAAGQLTELQKIGAFAGNSVSLIDVQKHIARDVHAIRSHLTSRGAGSGGAGGGSPGGFQ
jgi:hypothetical protein